MRKTLNIWLLLVPALLAACGGGNDSADDRIDVADPKVRFVHADPLGVNLNLYREAALQADATNVGYKFASNYFDVETGVANWPVKTTALNVEIGRLSFDAKRGDKNTIVAVNGLPTTQLLLIGDPYNKSLTSKKARVRIVNGALNAQNVDAYLTAPGVDIGALSPNFGAVAYKNAVPASGNDSVEFGAGNYQLRIASAGSKTTIFSAPVTLAENADLLLVAVPASVTPGAIKLLVVTTDDPSRAAVEVTSQ